MPRADLIVNLVKAGSQGDTKLLHSTVEALAAEERAKNHHQLADKLVSNLQPGQRNFSAPNVVRSYDAGHGGLLYDVNPERGLDDLLLEDDTLATVREVIEEQHRRDLLGSYGIEPRHRILLAGAPGNGKTSLAEAIASELMVPLFVVRYEAVIGSFLGETSSRLKKLFDFVRTHQCVLFFDEFDTLGKERGDEHETGEVKRVVSSLLLQIDALPSHVVVITATNHPELLDRAVWRRFQLRLELPAPSLKQSEAWLKRFQEQLGQPLGLSPKVLATQLAAANFSDLQQFCEDVHRRHILSLPSGNVKGIVRERLQQWHKKFSIK